MTPEGAPHELWALSDESLDTYLRQTVPTHHRLARSPRCELEIDPRSVQFELTTPVDGAEPDVTALERVEIDRFMDDDGEWFRMTVTGRDVPHEAYGLIVGIVAAMRAGASFAAATAGAVSNFKSVLASRKRLSTEAQIGLLGELFVVHRLLQADPEESVLDWWLGPEAEQHDFALPEFDVEVKTSTAERREHVIHGLGQLQPNPGRDLWLLSIQVTRGGGDHSVNLAGLVRSVTARMENRRMQFLRHLDFLGWREQDADLYQERFLMRHKPSAFLVSEDFPALTPDRIAGSVPHHERVSGVTYRVDISDRTPGDPGDPVSAVLDRTEFDHVP